MSKPAKLLRKGFKFPIYPTAEQKQLIERTFGCCRYVYNRASLSKQKSRIRLLLKIFLRLQKRWQSQKLLQPPPNLKEKHRESY